MAKLKHMRQEEELRVPDHAYSLKEAISLALDEQTIYVRAGEHRWRGELQGSWFVSENVESHSEREGGSERAREKKMCHYVALPNRDLSTLGLAWTCTGSKRDLSHTQKRPITYAKETYQHPASHGHAQVA